MGSVLEASESRAKIPSNTAGPVRAQSRIKGGRSQRRSGHIVANPLHQGQGDTPGQKLLGCVRAWENLAKIHTPKLRDYGCGRECDGREAATSDRYPSRQNGPFLYTFTLGLPLLLPCLHQLTAFCGSVHLGASGSCCASLCFTTMIRGRMSSGRGTSSTSLTAWVLDPQCYRHCTCAGWQVNESI